MHVKYSHVVTQACKENFKESSLLHVKQYNFHIGCPLQCSELICSLFLLGDFHKVTDVGEGREAVWVGWKTLWCYFFHFFFLYTIILFFLTELGGNFVFLSKINACIGLFQWKKMELQAKWEVEDLNVQKKIKKIWGSIQEHKLHIKIKQKLCKIDPQAELTNMWKSILVYYDPNDGNVMYPKNVIKSISNFRPVNTLNVNKTCLLQQKGEKCIKNRS